MTGKSWLGIIYHQISISPVSRFVLAGMYLVVITRKKKVGDLFGHTVWKAMEFDLVPYRKTVLHLTENQVISTESTTFTTELFTCRHIRVSRCFIISYSLGLG